MASATNQKMRAVQSTLTTMVKQTAKTKTAMPNVTHQNTLTTLTILMTTFMHPAESTPTDMVAATHTLASTTTHLMELAAMAALADMESLVATVETLALAMVAPATAGQ